MKQNELIVLLCLIWALTILYGEMFAYWVPSLFTCSWPHLRRSESPSSNSTMDSEGYQADYVKVAVIADPQALDAKVISFKKKRRKNYRRTKGHRQEQTKLRKTDIQGIDKLVNTVVNKTPKKAMKKQEKVAVAA